MQTEKRVLLLAVLIGLAVWLFDAVIDYLWFHQDSFLRLLVAPPPHEVYIRLVMLASFVVFGVIASRLVAKRSRAEQAVRESEQRLRMTVLGTSASTGPDLYRSLVQHLAGALGVKYALVARLLIGRSDRVRTLAVWDGQSHPGNFEYDLEGTPCHDVMSQDTCYYGEGIQARFPRDKLLNDMGAESYFGTPVIDSRGNTVGLVAVLDDKPFPRELAGQAVSLIEVFKVRVAAEIERQRHEAEREKLLEELAAHNEELEQFTYSVSHDLKSPIITVSSFVEILKEELAKDNSAGVQDALERVVGATNRMGELVNDLLKLARVGRVRSQTQVFELSDAVAEVEKLVSGPLHGKGVALVVDPDLPRLEGSRTLFVQLFQNLIENSVKYMGDPPDPQVHVGLREGAEDGPICFVRDNGIGIEEDYLERVFGVFEKLDAKSEGTGIGLAVAKRTVNSWGGKIWIESDGKGKGTTVCFTLPSPDSAPPAS